MSVDLTKLPATIQSFIQATNHFDANAFAETFADDALVNDAARNFWRKEAIMHWSSAEIIGAKVTITADEIVEHYGEYVITFLIDGNYDKSKVPDPLYLDYFFTVKNDKIAKLIIVKNKQKSAK